jgi:hypothetical protein
VICPSVAAESWSRVETASRKLPRALRAQVGLADLIPLDRVPEGANDRFLAHDLVEVLRAIFTVEGGHAVK